MKKDPLINNFAPRPAEGQLPEQPDEEILPLRGGGRDPEFGKLVPRPDDVVCLPFIQVERLDVQRRQHAVQLSNGTSPDRRANVLQALTDWHCGRGHRPREGLWASTC